MSWTLEGRPVGSVLVSRQRYLGDLVMASVVPQVLRLGDPGLRIGLLCEAAHGPVLAGQPDLDELHLLVRQRKGPDARARGAGGPDPGSAAPGSSGPRVTPHRGSWELARGLRRSRYDVAVDLFFNPWSAWLLWLSGIPQRIGGTPKWRRRLYTHTVQRSDPRVRRSGLEEVAPGGLAEHLCRLAPLVHAETGLPFLEWLKRNRKGKAIVPRLAAPAPNESARGALESLGARWRAGGTDPTGYLLLAPGATWPVKEWPAGRWRELIDLLVARTQQRLLVLVPPVGAGRWTELAKAIPAGRGGVLPGLALPAVLDLLAGARGVVSVDGGVLHAAVGLGRPTVGLFGPTDPAIWFPYEGAGPFRVLATRPACHPCDLHECGQFVCLPDLGAAEVAETFLGLLEGEGGA